VAALAVVLAVLAGSGCGVPSSGEPDRISAADLPSGLVEPPTTTTTIPPTTTTTVPPTTPTTVTPTSAAPSTTTTTTVPVAVLTVWLVGPDGLLRPVTRTAPIGAGPAEALAALDAGPTPQEQALGISSSLPSPGLVHLTGSPVRGRAMVTLTSEFYAQVVDQKFAFGQIVRTLGDAPNARISIVNFVNEGAEDAPRDVVDGENRSIGPDAQYEDYDSIVSAG
jgi:hypothetical protein